MATKYVSGRVKELKVGITNYSESKESLSVIGIVSATNYYGDGSTLTGIGQTVNTRTDSLNVVGVSTFGGDIKANGNIVGDNSTNITGINQIAAQTFSGEFDGSAVTASGDITANGNIVGDNSTNISGIASVTATSFHGDGSALTGIDATSLKDTDGTIRVQANTSGAVVTGVLTANSFVGGSVNTTGIVTASSIDAAISEWVLGANGSSDYTFTGPGLTGAENDPTIYLKRGQKYRFKNASGGHPFRIQSTVNGSAGTAYNDGITNNDAGNGTTLVWDVQFDAPDVLYYQCTAHTNMGGKIYIGNSGDTTTIGSLNATGVSTFASDVSFHGGVQLGNASSDVITGTGRFQRDLIPSANGSYDLGSNNPTFRWKTLHVQNILQSGSGISTFTNDIDANGNLDVSGITTLASVDINNGAIDGTNIGFGERANGQFISVDCSQDLDVDGHADLNNVSVTGVTTFTSNSNPQIQINPTTSTANGMIKYTGTKTFYIEGGTSSDNKVVIRGHQLNKNIVCEGQGQTELYYNDNKKLETTNHGAIVSGVLTATTFSGALEGNVTGNINGDLTGTLQTAAQPNVTSLGTITNLVASSAKVSDLTNGRVVYAGPSGELQDNANLTFNGSTLTAGAFAGDGSQLTNLPGIDTAGGSTFNDVFSSGINTLGKGAAGKTFLYHADSLKFQTTGIGVSVSSGTAKTAYIEGPEEIWIDPHPAGVGTTSGIVRIRGDLYVDGKEVIIDVEKLELGDFQIGIASTAGTNAELDGGGIGIGSVSIRKTITWNNATNALMCSENWNVASGKHYEIAGTDVLTATTLGSGVVNSSLTSLGTIASLTASTAKVSDLTSGRVVYAGASGELQDSSNLTFDGTTLTGTFAGNGAGLTNVSVTGINTGASSDFTDLVVSGNLNVTGITTLAGNIFLGDGGGDQINVNGQFISGLDPSSNNSFDLGTAGKYWRKLFIGDTVITNQINASGIVTAANFNSTSDIRLKDNIQVIEDPLAKLIQIEGVSFNWKENNKPALGVIADQVQEILPELVTDGDPKTVNYNGLIGLLIEAVKEQQIQIDELKSKLS